MHGPVFAQHALFPPRGGQAHGGGLFDDALAVNHGVQRAVHRPSLDGEGRAGGYPALQRQGLHALEQLVEAAGGEGAELEQYAFGKAGAYVSARQAALVRDEAHAAVRRRNVHHSQPPQLGGEGALHAEKAGGSKRKLHPHPSVYIDAQLYIQYIILKKM